MKQLFRTIVCGAFLLMSIIIFTSCEGALDDIFGEWSRPGSEDPYVLSAALKEGALVSYTIIENGVEKVITFKRVGNEYVLISPASTRSHDRVPPRKYILDWVNDGGAGTGGGGSLVLTVNADDETPALKAVTQIADASTQVAKYKEGYELNKMDVKSRDGKAKYVQAADRLEFHPCAVLKWAEDPNDSPLEIKLDIPNNGKPQWFEYADLLNLSTNKYSQIYITTQIKNESEEIEDVKFKVYNIDNSGNEVRSLYFDYVEARTYILKLDDETD